MADLSKILAQTRHKASLLQPSQIRDPVKIANEDRPYRSLSTEIQCQEGDTLEVKNESYFCIGTKDTYTKVKKTKGTLREQKENIKGTLREQKENIKGTLREQKGNIKGTLREQKGNTKGTLREPYREQVLERNKDESYVDKIQMLSGQQKKIIYFLLNKVVARGSIETGAITSEDLCNSCEITYESMKIQIKRLISKGLIIRLKGKKSKGGYMQFQIQLHIKNILLSIQQDFLKYHDKGNTKGTIQGTTAPVVSSSINIYKTTTTSEGVNCGQITKSSSLPNDWLSIDYSALEEHGFDEARLIQIYREYAGNDKIYLSTSVIQDSIDHFAFDLKYNDVAKTFRNSPVAVLTSMLKRGKPYSSVTPEKVLSPKSLALLKYAEAKKLADARGTEIEEQLQEDELSSWLKSFSADDLLNQFYDQERLEELKTTNRLSPIQKTLVLRKAEATAKEYFARQVWPSRRQAILSGLTQ